MKNLKVETMETWKALKLKINKKNQMDLMNKTVFAEIQVVENCLESAQVCNKHT